MANGTVPTPAGPRVLRRSPPAAVDPVGELLGIEAEQVAPLDEWDAALSDETADVSFADAEVFGDASDVEEPREPAYFWVVSVGHGDLLSSQRLYAHRGVKSRHAISESDGHDNLRPACDHE